MKFFKLFVLMAAAVAATQAMAAGDAEAGKAKAAPCAACHGQDGNKTLTGTYPKLAGQNKQYALSQMKDIKSGKRLNGMASAMKALVANVSDEELEAIADYLSKVK